MSSFSCEGKGVLCAAAVVAAAFVEEVAALKESAAPPWVSAFFGEVGVHVFSTFVFSEVLSFTRKWLELKAAPRPMETSVTMFFHCTDTTAWPSCTCSPAGLVWVYNALLLGFLHPCLWQTKVLLQDQLQKSDVIGISICLCL